MAGRRSKRKEESQRSLAELEAERMRWDSAPRVHGRLELIVVRPAANVRSCPEFAELDPERGLSGDRWLHAQRTRAAQVSLMDLRAARALAEPARWPLFGDNLIVDIDLSASALPAGTRVRVGSACIEITDEPHLGCKKFNARFGADALKWVNHKSRRELRLRGIYACVVEAGLLRVGDRVEVLGRG